MRDGRPEVTRAGEGRPKSRACERKSAGSSMKATKLGGVVGFWHLHSHLEGSVGANT